MRQRLHVIEKDETRTNAVADLLILDNHCSRRPDAVTDHSILRNADRLRELIRVAQEILNGIDAAAPCASPLNHADPEGIESPFQDALSPREIEVLTWVARGKSNTVIGDILEISAHTVDTHLRRAFAKLDTSNRTVAVVKAVQNGLITAPMEE